MSAKLAVIPSRALDDTRMTPAALRVLLEFGRHTNRQGWCLLKQEKIAKRIGIGRRAVNNQVQLLKEWGYLEKGGQLAPGRCNQWRVLHDPDLPSEFDRLAGLAEEDGDIPVPRHVASKTGAVPRLEMASGATSGDGTEGTMFSNGKTLSEGRAASAAPPPNGHLNGKTPQGLAQELVTFYVNVSREFGSEPTPKMKGQVGREISKLVTFGKSRRVLRRAVGLLAETGKQYTSLDWLVGEVERELAGEQR